MRKYPELSIIIVSLNSQRTLKDCLAYIKKQTYPKIKEVLLVDGGSKDNTLIIAKNSGLPIKIIKAAYENNQEARRAIGIQKAKNEICAMIDTDNFITDKNWLKAMVEPLVDNKLIAASQTLRYSAPKNSSLLNRYFGLLGSADPVAYYLGVVCFCLIMYLPIRRITILSNSIRITFLLLEQTALSLSDQCCLSQIGKIRKTTFIPMFLSISQGKGMMNLLLLKTKFSTTRRTI